MGKSRYQQQDQQQDVYLVAKVQEKKIGRGVSRIIEVFNDSQADIPAATFDRQAAESICKTLNEKAGEKNSAGRKWTVLPVNVVTNEQQFADDLAKQQAAADKAKLAKKAATVSDANLEVFAQIAAAAGIKVDLEDLRKSRDALKPTEAKPTEAVTATEQTAEAAA